MLPAEIHERLVARFGEKIQAATLEGLDPSIQVAAANIVEVAEFLRTDEGLLFDALNDLTVVDYFEPDPKKAAKFGHEPHLEVVYHLYSYALKHFITIKVRVQRWMNDEPGKLPEVPSVSKVWAIADWHEREAYDLMGVRFLDHPNLRRILCPEDWVGHPLRKDYEFPQEYHGIRVK